MALGFLESLAVSVASGAIAGYVAYRVQERKLKKELLLHDSAQRVANNLMSHEEYTLRSFKVIRHHLGGFEDNELRQVLVRAGAIRFLSKSGIELWGLVERNKDRLGVTRVDEDPAKMRDEDLIP